MHKYVITIILALMYGCTPPPAEEKLSPIIVTEPVQYDTDDPAIWVCPDDPAKSLIIGTDKDKDGGLYVFDLDGKIVADKCVHNLKRPNNVDIEYGLPLNGIPTDICVTTERLNNQIRIFSLPDMKPIDNGGIAVFEGDSLRAPMGIALYKRPSDEAIFAIVGRKKGATDAYLWQYRLQDDGKGMVKADLVRKFGTWSGTKEIEAIAVDDELGYVYYCDEKTGIRKYPADPDSPNANTELALFGTDNFTNDREGISIYDLDNGKGYILVSDQQADRFNIYPREGTKANKHEHPLLKSVNVSTHESDGSDIYSGYLNEQFPHGIFVAMSTNKTFQYYAWEQIAGKNLDIK